MDFDGRARIGAQLNVAPLVDVMFLLLIFFLLTSSYIAPEAIDLVLPKSTTATPSDQREVVVTLSATGAVAVDGLEVEAGGIESAVAEALAASSARAVGLKSDAGVSVQAMLDVLDAVRRAGATELSLMTRR